MTTPTGIHAITNGTPPGPAPRREAGWVARLFQHIVDGDDCALAWPRISFAGWDDIRHFSDVLWWTDIQHGSDRQQQQLILAGSSRGASTVLGAVTHNMPIDQVQRIAFVLLEGPFDTVPAIAEARYGWLLGRIISAALPWLTRYDPTFPSPLELAARFPPDVPVLLVASEADWHVPLAHSMRIYDALRQARGGNGSHLHLLVLKHSHHSFFVNDHLDDQAAYRLAMESMYQRYVVS